jgi:hypothetical protein
LYVGVHGYGIVTLHQGVERLMQVNRVTFVPTQLEILPRDELLNGKSRTELDKVSQF